MNRSALTLSLIVAFQVAFVCSTFSSWGSIGIVSLLLMAIVYLRSTGRFSSGPFPASWTRLDETQTEPPRSLFVIAGMASIALITVAWRLLGLQGGNLNFIFIIVDFLAHFGILAVLFLWVTRPSSGHVLMLFLGLAVVLLCVAGGGVTRSLASQTTVGLFVCLGFIAESKIVLSSTSTASPNVAPTMVGSSQVAAPVDARHNEGRLQRQRVVFATIIAMMMVTGAIASVTDHFLPAVQNDLQDRLQSGVHGADRNSFIGGMRYVRGSHLGSIRDHLSQDPSAIVLRVFARQRPGYLRGTVFDIHQRNSWSSISELIAPGQREAPLLNDRLLRPAGIAQTSLRSNPDSKLQRFELAPPDSSLIAELEIVGEPERGSQTFLPLSSRWVEARSSELIIDQHGSVRRGIDISRPYVAGAAALPAEDQLSSNRRTVATYLTPEQKDQLRSTSEYVFEDGSSTKQKAAAVSSFFQDNFRYGLTSPKRPRNSDPLSFFLSTRHDAHCEYFATATALLLRTVGVPTRYVTGYIADEEDEEATDLWLARNRDAHAWAEAYDDETKRWFVVESTPGRRYQPISPVDPKSLGSQSGKDFDSGTSFGSDSIFMRLWSYLASFRATDVFYTVFRYSQIALLIGLVGWLFRRWRGGKGSEQELADRASRRMLAKVDRFCRRYGFVREKSESVYRFADRIEAESQVQRHQSNNPDQAVKLDRAIVWLRAFADARYQGQDPPVWTR